MGIVRSELRGAAGDGVEEGQREGVHPRVQEDARCQGHRGLASFDRLTVHDGAIGGTDRRGSHDGDGLRCRTGCENTWRLTHYGEPISIINWKLTRTLLQDLERVERECCTETVLKSEVISQVTSELPELYS